MAQVRIVTDSASDLPPKEAAELGITVVPLVVTMGEETFWDGEMDLDAFWERAAVVHPKSSQPPVGAFQQAYAPLVEEGYEVICITVTSKHSGTYNSAMTAAQAFEDKVTVFDSWSLSWGQRFQAEAAAEAARQGKSRQEILALLEDIRDRTHLFILLDTIEFLKRGGRAARFITIVEKVISFFNIKPLLNMKEGELGLLGTANSQRRGLLRIQREVAALGECERLAILHTRSQDVAAGFAATLRAKLDVADEIPVRETGAVLSVHAGPGVVALGALEAGD